jgi:hypothetical protein
MSEGSPVPVAVAIGRYVGLICGNDEVSMLTSIKKKDIRKVEERAAAKGASEVNSRPAPDIYLGRSRRRAGNPDVEPDGYHFEIDPFPYNGRFVDPDWE